MPDTKALLTEFLERTLEVQKQNKDLAECEQQICNKHCNQSFAVAFGGDTYVVAVNEGYVDHYKVEVLT